jgi:hypothetical protein
MSQSHVIPAELLERLAKAEGHINGVERRLWEQTERAIWSGRQAMARAAESWLRLHDALDALPPLTRSLPADTLQQRLDELDRAAPGTALAAPLAQIAAAETAIRAEPFPPSDPGIDRDALTEGLARQHRYLDALRLLLRAVEDAIADRYLTLRPGDWAWLPGGHLGRMTTRPGLSGWFLVPAVAMNSPFEAMKGWLLTHPAINNVDPGPNRPIGSPSYYYLVDAHRHWRKAGRLLRRDWSTLSSVLAAHDHALDAAARAWRIEQDPGAHFWSTPYPTDTLRGFADRAPPMIAEPLLQALRISETLRNHTISSFRRPPTDWRVRALDMLDVLRSGFAMLADALKSDVDLAVGDWVQSPGLRPARLAHRDGERLVIDLSGHGIEVVGLFECPLQRVPRATQAPATEGRWHRRWLWFASHQGACGGRTICVCCGLPGIEADTADKASCLLCGWRHDGGSLDPQRPNFRCEGLTLAFGRFRIEALGHAVIQQDRPGRALGTSDPCVLAGRHRLVVALDAMVDGWVPPGSSGDRLDTLWSALHAALHTYSEETQQ